MSTRSENPVGTSEGSASEVEHAQTPTAPEVTEAPNVNSASATRKRRSEWRGAQMAARFLAFKQIWIPAPEHDATLKLVNEKSRYVQLTGECEGLLVICESGGGKTTLCRRMLKTFPEVTTPEKTIRQMIVMRIPKICTRAQLAKELLRALGDPACDLGDAEKNLQRAIKLINATGVKVLAVDNFQDIPERRSTGSVRVVGNWFRDLFDEIALVFIALGTEQAKKVRFSNDQVRRRIVTVKHIPYFNTETDTGLVTWMKVLGQLDDRLPMAERANLATPRLASLLFVASHGVFDYLCKLLKRAMMVAVERGSERIEKPDLMLAFALIAGDVVEMGNPFEEGFRGGTLTRIDDLFYRMENAKTKNGSGANTDADEEAAEASY